MIVVALSENPSGHILSPSPSLCRWDSQRAPSGGRTPGEGSRTQPGCCSRLRPSPNSNWCHCNMKQDPGVETKYHSYTQAATAKTQVIRLRKIKIEINLSQKLLLYYEFILILNNLYQPSCNNKTLLSSDKEPRWFQYGSNRQLPCFNSAPAYSCS